MEFSLRSFLKLLTKKELDELNELIEDYDPVESNLRFKKKEKDLGLDNALTAYHGNGEQRIGITKWVDRRNNNKYELKTHIEVEVYGTRMFKDYFHITTINGRAFKRARQKECTDAIMTQVHELYRNLFISRAISAYSADPNTNFETVFD